MKFANYTAVLGLLSVLGACGGDAAIDRSCDEPQRYQAVQAGNKLTVPEGLDPLNEFAEMPIPSAEGSLQRPKGSPCIDLPPTIGTSNN